jgi:hypothetical protein
MQAPVLDYVCSLHVELDKPLELGAGRSGTRRIIPIIGGRVTGERLKGRVLNLGADWQTVFRDGVAELDTRYTLETDDGALIDIANYGFRHGPEAVMNALARGEDVDPTLYYMRTQARLETGDARYAWVNRTVFVGMGRRLASAVLIDLYAVC